MSEPAFVCPHCTHPIPTVFGMTPTEVRALQLEAVRLANRLREEEEAHAALQVRCYEGFPTGTDGIFDALLDAETALRERDHE